MSELRETKRFTIRQVVVTAHNIRNIAEIMKDCVSRLQGKSAYMAFKVVTSDGSEYSSASSDIFAETGILSTKSVVAVEMNYGDFSGGYDIRFSLTHGNESWFGNAVSVSGKDSVWVNGTIRRIEDAVKNWEQQPSWPKRLRTPVLLLFSFGIGRLAQIIIRYAVYAAVPFFIGAGPPPQWVVSFVEAFPWFGYVYQWLEWLFALGIGLWPAMVLLDRLQALWPNVEIRAGPEYAQVLRIKRQRLWQLVTLGILPLMLSIIADAIRLYLNLK